MLSRNKSRRGTGGNGSINIINNNSIHNATLGKHNNHDNHYDSKRNKQQQQQHRNSSIINRNYRFISSIVVTTVLFILLSWFYYLIQLIENDKLLHHGQFTIHYDGKKEMTKDEIKSNNAMINSSSETKKVVGKGILSRFVALSKTAILRKKNKDNTASSSIYYCNFRRYPIHRYYKVSLQEDQQKQPDFLTGSNVEYIFGTWPIVLQQSKKATTTTNTAHKICVNQTEWWIPTLATTTGIDNTKNSVQQQGLVTTWPFADGTNPSIILMSRLLVQAPDIANMILQHYPTTYYIVSICMTNSQCTWKDTEDDRSNNFDLPNLQQKEPNTVRTVLQLLDIHHQTIQETTIYLERDASWGKKVTKISNEMSKEYTYTPALDDARLFVYHQQLYVSYREGPGFGYDVQVLNPIHIDVSTDIISSSLSSSSTMEKTIGKRKMLTTTTIRTMTATIKASESSSFCCGRNMALMPDYYYNNKPSSSSSSPPSLYALTWVDPVTVEHVDTTPIHIKEQQKQRQQRHRRLLHHNNDNADIHLVLSFNTTYHDAVRLGYQHNNNNNALKQRHRRLKEEKVKVHKSHIHGTNAFMVPIPMSNSKNKKWGKKQQATSDIVYLGVAHFHRPNDRKPNIYARFGHHYTHAFYTIAPKTDDVKNDINDGMLPTSFYLVALSQEFVLPSVHVPNDAEIIQFISGLEYNDITNEIIMSYGINDCEGAIISIPLSIVHDMLRPTETIGRQVVDFMLPLLTTNNIQNK